MTVFLRLLIIFGPRRLIGGGNRLFQQRINLWVIVERAVSRQPFLSDSNQ